MERITCVPPKCTFQADHFWGQNLANVRLMIQGDKTKKYLSELCTLKIQIRHLIAIVHVTACMGQNVQKPPNFAVQVEEQISSWHPTCTGAW